VRTPETVPVLTERRGGVLVVTLNRPEARNAVNEALADGLAAAMDVLDASDALAVGVLVGAGKGFCAGMDLKAFLNGERSAAGGRGFAGIVQRPPGKPLIAAVEGFAVAGGLEIALACDVIVAGEGARFGLPEVKRALVATGGGLRRLPQRVSSGRAFALALTGSLIDADEAEAIGLVDRRAPAGKALDEALALAEAIAVNGPLALRATKEILTRQRDWPDTEFWDRQETLAAVAMASEDAREGSLAFTEKRPPRWQGR
jgi:enoyl-CoA hydratase